MEYYLINNKCFQSEEEKPYITNFPPNELGRKTWKMCCDDWTKSLKEVDSDTNELNKITTKLRVARQLTVIPKDETVFITDIVELKKVCDYGDECNLYCGYSKCNNEVFKLFFRESLRIEEEKENIIRWITQRIKDEQRKHSSHDDNWQEVAARKIYATYIITLKQD